MAGKDSCRPMAWRRWRGNARVRRVTVRRRSRAPSNRRCGVRPITSQLGLGTWPVRADPLRFTPEGGVLHSGYVRVANSGAVRLEIADAAGMMQLAPAQFPGGAIEQVARQLFVYRFPSANY